MKTHHSILRFLAGPSQALACAFSLLAIATGTQAATITKAATGTDLTAGASWTGSAAPGSGDVANWASTSLGAGLTIGSATSWSGIYVASGLSAIGVTGAGPLTLGSGGIDMSTSTVNLTLGTPIALGASQTWNVNSGKTLTASGILSGSGMGLSKASTGTLTLQGANTYDGTTTILGGTLIADTSTTSTPTILNSSSGLAFTGSGTFQLLGKSAQTRTQTLNGLTLTAGAATIDANNTGTSTTIDLRGTGGSQTITRSAGATVDFKASAGTFGTNAVVKTAQANDATGILGAWATVSTGTDWAINNGSGVAAAYTGYNTLSGLTLATGASVNYRVATNPTTPTGNITLAALGTTDINTLRISDTAARTIDIENGSTQGILRFGAVGGLLASGGNHQIGLATATGGTLTAGGATVNNPGELVVNNSSSLAINSVIANNGSGAVSLTKSGTGTVTLNASNSTYSGGTFINAGSVSTATGGSVGVTFFGTGLVTVNSGATLSLNNTWVSNNVTLNSATVSAGNSFGSTLAGSSITLTGISTFSITGNLTLSGNLTGAGGLIKTGSSTVPVTGTNTYTGPTTISGGPLTFSKPAALYNATTASWTPANITVASGATLGFNFGGASDFTNSQITTLLANLATGISNNGLLAGSAVGFDTSNGSGTFSGTIADSTGVGGGSVGVNKIGGNTLTLSGNNTFSGPASVGGPSGTSGGTLVVYSFNSVNGGTPLLASSSLGCPTTVANGTITCGNGSSNQGVGITYLGTGETSDRVIAMNAGVSSGGTALTLDQSGTGALKFSSAFVYTGATGSRVLQIQGSTTGTGELGGTIANPSGSSYLSITKAGTGTWTLSGANTYAPVSGSGGITTINGGCLVLKNATALPGGIGATGGISPLTFNGGVLGLGTGDFTRPLGAAGTATGVNFTGNGGWAAYGADRIVNLGGASASVIWATASTGLNAKTLILSNATADHMVDFQNPLDLGSTAETVQVDDGSAAIDGKLSGNITGVSGGNLTKTGNGTLALTGTNNYAGTTTVSAGTLLVNGTNSGTGLVTVASGATLGGTGSLGGAATFSTGAKAVCSVTRDPITLANTTPLTIAGVMTFNSTVVHLNLPANLPSGTYTLATSSATPTGTVTATPVVDSGGFASGFTTAVVSLDTANKKLVLTVNGLATNPTQLAITSINGGASPVATAPFSIVVQAQDANGDTRKVVANTAITLTLNTGSGPLGGTLTGTIPAGSVSVTFSGITYGTAESGVVLAATRTSGDSLTAATSAPFTVLPSSTPTYLTVAGFPSPQTAGVAGSVTVTAKTATGVTATTYTGTVHFTSSSTLAGLPADYTFVLGDNGVHVFTGVTLNTAGTQSITATDTVSPTITGSQSAITVNPAAATSLIVAGFPSPRVPGAAGSVTVTAKDAYNNTVTAYTGTIHFTSSDGAAALPANYTFTGGDAGTHTFSNGVTLNTLGTQSITATDTVTSSITGSQSAITVWNAPTSFTWRNAASGTWSDATKWAQSGGIDYAPLAAGEADYTLNFIAGTYTATQNLNNNFLVNQLNFAGAVTVDGTSTIAFTNNGATLPQLNQNSSSGISLVAPIALNANLTCAGSGSGTVAISGNLSGTGSLTKSMTGTMTLSGTSNTYSGGTNITAGALTLGGTANDLLGTGTVTVASGATLNLNGNGNLTNSFVFNGATVTDGNSFSANIYGPVTLGATTTFDLGTTGNMTLGGNISGSGGLTKIGTTTSPLIISGANTFTGPVTIAAGTLQVSSINSVTGGSATSNMGAPTTAANGTIAMGTTTSAAALTYTGTGETTDRMLKLTGTTGGATFTLSGPRSGLLKFTSNLSIPGTAAVDNRKTLTLTGTGTYAYGSIPGSGEIAGSIGDSLLGTAGQLATSVTKAGTCTWTLSGANTYSGATHVQAGTLALSQVTSLGSGPLDITSGAVAQLNYIGTRQITALTFNAGTALPNGTYGSSASLAANKNDTYFSGPGTVTVGPLSSSPTLALALSSGGNPSAGGTPVTFTATVTGNQPTGYVLFYDGTTQLGAGTLNASHQTGFTTSLLTGGSHSIIAVYPGDSNNGVAYSTTLAQTVADTRTATTTTLALTAGGNPSAFGGAVTFTATVTGTAPSGSVAFYDNSVLLGTATLNGSAQAVFTTSGLAVGYRIISAAYLGDAVNAPSSTATTLFQSVSPPAGNGKWKVFILAGQSNMQGKSAVETGRDPNNYGNSSFAGGLGSLRNMLNKNVNRYGYLADPAHPVGSNPGWITRSDVSVTYWSDPGTGENRRGNLDPYFGDTGEGGYMGPEYAFGLVVGSQLADQVLLIKYAFGGKSLKVDFRPPSSGGTVGPYYTGMLSTVNQVLANLTTYFPGYTGGGYEISGFGWHQGWNDIGETTAEYETNLTNLINDLRTALGVPNLPVSIGNTGMANGSGGNVLVAQLNVGNPTLHPEFAGTVTTVDTRPYDFGNAAGATDEGYHWNRNAESYFNIGDQMGKAMVNLLGSQSSAKDILTFAVPGQTAATIATNTIAITVPYGTDVTALAPAFTLSPLATATPVTGAARNFTAPQTYTVTAQNLTTKTYTVTVSVSSSPYYDWASNPALGLTAGVNDGPLMDPDHDGIPNLLEFVLGGLPMTSSLSVLPTFRNGSGQWLFEYNRNRASLPPATTQVVQYSNDMATWNEITVPATSSGAVTVTPGSTFDHVAVTIPSANPQTFVRLKVSQ